MKYILIAYHTAACCVVAAADEVKLKNGRTLVGIARHEEPNRVVVETRFGDIRVLESEVQAIEPGRSDIHEYKEKLDALGSCPSAAQLFELAQWAEERGLGRYVNGLLTQVVELEPDHAEARRLLGYARLDGNWMPSSERRAIMRAREAEHRTVTVNTVPVRRTRPRIEETPYPFSLPLLPDRSSFMIYPPRSPVNTGGYSSSGYSGGYVMSISGVTPGGDVVINYPLRANVGRITTGGPPFGGYGIR